MLSKFSEIYFRNTLTEGTPFTQMGARELRRLGIMTMVIPTGCNEASVILGIMFIIGSFLCGYGAELAEKKNMAQTERKIL